jgi:hypothetical protein
MEKKLLLKQKNHHGSSSYGGKLIIRSNTLPIIFKLQIKIMNGIISIEWAEQIIPQLGPLGIINLN